MLAVASCSSVRDWEQKYGIQYPLLGDKDHLVSEAYGVYELFSSGKAAPAVFIIDPTGRVEWRWIAEGSGDQVSMQTILDNLP